MKSFAVLQLSGCAGCEVSLLNAPDWINKIKLTYMPLVITAYRMPEVDVLLVSGGVQSDEGPDKLPKAIGKGMHVRQPQARPAPLVAAVEAVENVRQLFRQYPGAVVRDSNF